MLGTEVCLLTLPSSPELSEILIAEHLSARQLIPHCISEIVSMYVCLYVCMYVSITLRNAIISCATCKRTCTCASVAKRLS